MNRFLPLGDSMPTVLRLRGFEFYFYSEEGNEPPHVHVDKGDGTAKFWLQPVRLVYHYGLKPSEVRQAVAMVNEHQAHPLYKWNEYFGE
jgi:hypothetical protein